MSHRRCAQLLALCLTLTAPGATALADRAEHITLDAASEHVAQLVLGGSSEGGTPRLMEAAIGDLDGDGVDDLAFGAPGADPNDVVAAGSVYILFGRADLLGGQRQVDLSRVDSFDLRIDGAIPGARLGYRVAIGDVDGDGIGDLVTTAPGRRGALYLKLGHQTWPRGTMVIGPTDTYDVAFVGPADNSLLGASLCVGDLDQDRRAELVFASLGFDAESGAVTSTDLHVVPGRPEWPRQAFAVDDHLPGRALLTRRVAEGTRAIHTCALGDLDDNGSGDIIAAMPLDRGGASDEFEEAGSVAVVADALAWSGGVIDLGASDPEWGYRILGDQTGAHLGAALAIADLNGDQRSDLVLGSPERLVVGPVSEGAVHVLWGGLLPRRGARALLAPDLTLVGEGGGWGGVLATPDLSGDGRAELLVGAPSASSYAGEKAGLVDVFIGGPHLNEATETVRRDKRIVGAGLGDGLGHAMVAGDLDADGALELVVRAAGNVLERREAGSLYLINAELSSFAAESVIDDLLPIVLVGPGRGGRLLTRVLHRDLDGDGTDEWLWASPEGAGTRGLVCVVRTVPQQLDLSDPAQCLLRVLGPSGQVLSSFDAGDLDGDGRMELVLGLDGRDSGGEASGAGAVLAARLPEDLTGELRLDTPANPGALGAEGALVRAWLGGRNAEGLGAQVDVADLDGDGMAEVVMGADRASWEDRALAGAVFVAAGGEGAALRRTWSVVSEEEPGVRLRFEGTDGSRLGRATRLLDLDADGRRDLALSAPLATVAGENERGTLYVIYDVFGLAAGGYSVSDPDVVALEVHGAARGAGVLAHGAQDVDGDGVDDLIVVSPWESVDALQHGAAYVVYGARERRRAQHVRLGEESGAELRVIGERGMQLDGLRVSDLDGDGRRELVVSSRPHTRPDLRPSVSLVELEAGRPAGVVALSREGGAALILEAGPGWGPLSLPESMLDVDGDGQVELWLFETTADAMLSDQGAALRIVLGEALSAASR